VMWRPGGLGSGRARSKGQDRGLRRVPVPTASKAKCRCSVAGTAKLSFSKPMTCPLSSLIRTHLGAGLFADNIFPWFSKPDGQCTTNTIIKDFYLRHIHSPSLIASATTLEGSLVPETDHCSRGRNVLYYRQNRCCGTLVCANDSRCWHGHANNKNLRIGQKDYNDDGCRPREYRSF
jgi:hypothetical protein